MKIYVVFICLSSFYSVLAQSNYISGIYSNATSSSIVLSLDCTRMKFSVYKAESSNPKPEDVVITYNYISGNITLKKDYIICNDEKTKKQYKLKVLSDERLKNCDIPFVEDTLYVIVKPKSQKNGERYMGRWKNGKKDGSWRFITNTGKDYYKFYKDGKLIKTGNPKDLK
ncbi:hypothetical protein [Dysgonomonas sp. HGC4]|nr:hypothetical protein [Dysgonomonas sp. HGC4]